MPGSNRIRGALLSCSASLGVDISGSGSILIRATNEDGVLSAVQILLHVVGVGVVVVLVFGHTTMIFFNFQLRVNQVGIYQIPTFQI